LNTNLVKHGRNVTPEGNRHLSLNSPSYCSFPENCRLQLISFFCSSFAVFVLCWQIVRPGECASHNNYCKKVNPISCLYLHLATPPPNHQKHVAPFSSSSSSFSSSSEFPSFLPSFLPSVSEAINWIDSLHFLIFGFRRRQ
jgi:hypothetical protein